MRRSWLAAFALAASIATAASVEAQTFPTGPKIELHVHLEGAIPHEVLWELLQKYGGDAAVPTREALVSKFVYRDFPHFLEMWTWKNGLLRSYEDFEFLGPEGVVHLPEVAFPAVPELFLLFPPPGRQKNTAGPAVLRVTLAADELLLFQPRQHLADGVGVREGLSDQITLGDAVLLGQQGQHHELVGRHAKLLEMGVGHAVKGEIGAP